jgi:hypothetical protein
MKEIMVPRLMDYENEAYSIVKAMDSAFIEKDQLKGWIKNSLEEAANRAKDCERKRIEDLILKKPELVENHLNTWSFINGGKKYKIVEVKEQSL